MKQFGLILAPELITWTLPTQDAGVDRLPILPRRACFTELSVEELAGHSQTFGPISLAFSIDRLRAAGLTPVIYVPQGGALGALDQMASFCVKAAWHTRYVLQRLDELKNASDPVKAQGLYGYPLAPGAVLNLQNVDEKGQPVATYAIPAATINQFMQYVGFRNIPFDHSIGMLSVFLDMFYPTDNMHTGELLGYYRQREWRLIGGELRFNNASTRSKILKAPTYDRPKGTSPR